MKLLWLDINCSYAHASLALPAIHAQCGDRDAEWAALSSVLSTSPGRVAAQIVVERPDILAGTAWLFTREYLLQVIVRAKALLPKTIVILGGPEFLGENELFLRREPSVDAVFRGEGEEAFSRWLKVAGKRSEWASIPGLCYLDEHGAYRDNGRAQVSDFAALNPPEASRFFFRDKPFVQLESARGCFSRCSFCVSGAEKPVRTIPVGAVRRRIAQMKARGVQEIRLLDRTFNGDPRRAMELLDVFSEYSDLRFHLELHPALLPDELRRRLAALPTGLLHVEAGIQSLREPVLNACRRAGRLEDALDGLRFLCERPNLVTHADLIVGLPLYTLEHVFEDVRTLAAFGAGEIQLELLKVLPGTALRREAEALGVVYSPVPPYEVLKTREMNVDDIQTGRQLSRLLDFYYNARAWQGITMRLIREKSAFLSLFLEWMRRGEYLEQPLSVEKRGLLLYEFIAGSCPVYVGPMAEAWLAAGLSPRKLERFGN
jgi:radical SAM superfamily enzyme YgiQ (UPF0313 family)